MKPQHDPRSALRSMVAMIGTTQVVQVDRPLGSRHPRHPDLVYPLNYGFVPGTIAADGDEIDAYIIGVETPRETFEGSCIAVIHRLDDVEDKLVVAPIGAAFSSAEIRTATDFQERYFRTRLVRARTEL